MGVYRLVYKANGHTFIVQFNELTRRQALRSFGLMAANKDIPFDWCDAAAMTRCVREMKEFECWYLN